jgi:hypothetical protein
VKGNRKRPPCKVFQQLARAQRGISSSRRLLCRSRSSYGDLKGLLVAPSPQLKSHARFF